MNLLSMFKDLFKIEEYINPYPKCPDCNVQFEYCGCTPSCQLIDCPKCGKDIMDIV